MTNYHRFTLGKNYIALLFTVLLLSSLQTSAQNAQKELPTTVVPERSRLKKFMPSRHEAKLKEAKQAQVDFVMIGDSITHNWESQKKYVSTFADINLLNLGFAGDGTQHVLWRLQHGALDGISPKLVTLMIGTNNLHLPKKDYKPNKPEDIYTGIQAVVAEVRGRLPNSKLIVFSIFPRKPGPAYERVKEVNTMLPQIADNKHIFHIDLNKHFLDQNGKPSKALYSRDGLHLSALGYDVWSKALKPLLAAEGLKINTSLP